MNLELPDDIALNPREVPPRTHKSMSNHWTNNDAILALVMLVAFVVGVFIAYS